MFEIGKVDIFNSDKQLCKHEKKDVQRLRSFRMSLSSFYKTPFYSITSEEFYSSRCLFELISKHDREFDIWWNERFIDIMYEKCQSSLSNGLKNHMMLDQMFNHLHKYKSYWWIPQLISWDDDYARFTRNQIPYEEFVLWNPNWLNVDNKLKLVTRRYLNDDFLKWWHLLTTQQKNDIYSNKSRIIYFIRSASQYVDIWWDDKIDRDYCLEDLMLHCYKNVNVWWVDELKKYTLEIPHKFIKYLSSIFLKWFDKNTWDYKKYSFHLTLFFPQYVQIWWDKNKFNYSQKYDIIQHDYYYRKETEDLIKDVISECTNTNLQDLKISIDDYKYSRDMLFVIMPNMIHEWWTKKYFKSNDKTFRLLELYCNEFFKNNMSTEYITWKLRTE